MTTTIRCSGLPGYRDCSRRQAARMLSGEIKEAGYNLRDVPTHVGAMVGTAVHAAAEYTLRQRLETGLLGNAREAEDRGIAAFKERIHDGALWDATTPHADTAQRQIARMTTTYRTNVAPNIEPIAVEEKLQANWPGAPDFTISGTSDSFVSTPDGLEDLKTGAVKRANQAQYGGYIILAEAHGRRPRRVWEDFIRRCRLSTEQPMPERRDYDVSLARWTASEIIDSIIRDVRTFRARKQVGGAPPEMAFAANPGSMLCGEKWCPAHGTSFCKEWAA